MAEIEQWFEKFNWKKDPFILDINPELFVGYSEQCSTLISHIKKGQKLCLIIGPTGSGKTTLMKWINNELKNDENVDELYLGKPPKEPEEFKEIFSSHLDKSFIYKIFPFLKHKPDTLNEIPEYVNKKLGEQKFVLMCDEIHETSKDVLEWLRVLNDQVENMTVVISGLPVFEEKLKKELESFQKRITTRVELFSLSREDTRELIRKRIENVGGKDTIPFTEETINFIYEKTGGFPREVLRLANEFVTEAIEKDATLIRPNLIKVDAFETRKETKKNLIDIENLPNRQLEIIRILSEGEHSPTQIVKKIDLERYKSEKHALRSVNNILQRLKKDGVITRNKKGRTFVYGLTSKYKTVSAKS